MMMRIDKQVMHDLRIDKQLAWEKQSIRYLRVYMPDVVVGQRREVRSC